MPGITLPSHRLRIVSARQRHRHHGAPRNSATAIGDFFADAEAASSPRLYRVAGGAQLVQASEACGRRQCREAPPVIFRDGKAAPRLLGRRIAYEHPGKIMPIADRAGRRRQRNIAAFVWREKSFSIMKYRQSAAYRSRNIAAGSPRHKRSKVPANAVTRARSRLAARYHML